MSESFTETRVRQIGRIRCLDELEGYEGQAKQRGLTADEMSALSDKRAALAKAVRK